MIVNVDAKYLDWLSAVYLSNDQVGKEEIWKGSDLHTDNQKQFNLSSRLIAKVFLFRIIFGGTAYSFSLDPEFADNNFSVDEWEEVINKFYLKYKGVQAWHNELISKASKGIIIKIPTGRSWEYRMERDHRGELKLPIPKIKNYPVQGLEADLMMLARIPLYQRVKKLCDVLIVNTVHDSLMFDVHEDYVEKIINIIKEVFRSVPEFFEYYFKVPFDLPFRGEISVGNTWGDLKFVDTTHTF